MRITLDSLSFQNVPERHKNCLLFSIVKKQLVLQAYVLSFLCANILFLASFV